MSIDFITRKSGSKDTVIAVVISIFFFIIGLWLISYHEMWRDEMETWSIARTADSFSELLQNSTYSGHPTLWFFLVYCVTRFTDLPYSMQILHITIATINVFLFVRFAPFSRLFRLLFVLGYFPLYEYAMISRNYAIGFTAILLTCMLLSRKRTNYIMLAVLLGFMSQSSAVGVIAALAFGLGILIKFVQSEGFAERNKQALQHFTIALFIVIAGIGISIYDGFPPPNRSLIIGDSDAALNMSESIATVWKSYFPIPEDKLEFWNTNFVGSESLRVTFSITLFLIGILMFYRSPYVLVIYIAGTIGLFLWFHFKYFGSLRHHGYLYLIFISCLWLINVAPGKNSTKQFARHLKSVFLFILLLSGIVGAYIAIKHELSAPFSQAKNVAKYIKAEGWESHQIIAKTDHISAPIAGYLNEEIFYADRNVYGTFLPWKNTGIKLTDKEFLEKMEVRCKQKQEDLLIIYQAPMNDFEEVKIREGKMEKLKEFTGAIVYDENYFLYKWACDQ